MVGKTNLVRIAGSMVAILVVISCGDLFNSNNYNVKKVVASPDEVLPIANGSLTIADFLSKTDSANIRVDTDGLIYLEYDQTLKSQDINSLLTFPDKTFSQTLSVPHGSVPANSNSQVKYVSQSFTLDFGFNPEKLSELKFKTTSLKVTATLSSSNPNLVAQVDFPDFSLNGNAYSQQFAMNSTTVVDLSGYVAAMTNNQFPVTISVYVKPHNNTITINSSTLTIKLAFNGIDYKYVIGFMGDQTTNMHGDTINFNAFGTSLSKGNVTFAAPELSFSLVNDYGIPLNVTFSPLKAENNNGNQLSVITNPSSPITVNIPAQLGQSATTNVGVTNTNQLIDFVPSRLYYKASGHINQGLTSGSNFCADTSKFRVNFHAKIPLYGKASNIILADTIPVDLSDQQNSNIQSGSIIAKITNQMPLDAVIQIYLADDQYHILDSLFTTEQTALIKASTVDGNGELQSASTLDETIDIPADKLNEIFTTKNIIIRSVMNTTKDTNGNQVNVKFKASYKMDAVFGLKLKLKFEQDL